MATLHPALLSIHPTSLGSYRERDVLALLEQGLPAGFDVFHSVDWSAMHEGRQTFGEVDVVVMGPGGHLTLLEVKAGAVDVSDAGLTKSYGGVTGRQDKNVAHQARRQHSGLVSGLEDAGLGAVRVAHFVVLPDQQVAQGTVGYPRERIIDAGQMDSLSALVRGAFPAASLPPATRAQVHDFLVNRFRLQPDPSTLIGQVQRASVALADGLATWVPRISHAGGVFLIEATAGSGKTQLALALLRDASARKLRSAYVCFNRSLADHIASVSPPAAEVTTFHEYCAHFARSRGTEPDFADTSVYARLADALCAQADAQVARLDLLVVDESQDFEPAWVEALGARLKPDGLLYVLGDPDQQVYPREIFEMAEAVHVKCMDNFRSPVRVVDAINSLHLASEPVTPKSAYPGDLPGFEAYGTGKKDGFHALEKCLKKLLAEGYTAAQIAVITFAGRERSELLAAPQIAGLSTRRFLGTYDSAGNALWSDGELLVETIYRFKGQSAPVVVLCEIDFKELTSKELRKLFVGFTRAQLRLECLLSEAASGLLMSR